MTKNEFKKILNKYDLAVNEFLDLRDSWNKLSGHAKTELLIEESRINVSEDDFNNILSKCSDDLNVGWWSVIEDPELTDYLTLKIADYYGVDIDFIENDPVYQKWLEDTYYDI